MSKAYICLQGCDDSTYAEIEMTKTELEVIERIFALVNEKSTSRCTPKAQITQKKPDYWASDYDFEFDELLEGENK
jgi:hypothetical protein